MFYSHEDEKKQLVVKAGILLSERGLVERTWGNVSVRLDDWHFAISPSGASYVDLRPEDIPIVNLKDLSFVGRRKPSSELFIHSCFYSNYPNISFILHTHQRFASLLSLFFAKQQGNFEVLDEYKSILGKAIPSAEYAEAGTKKIAENVIKAFTTLKEHSFSTSNGVVLMAAHGVVCFASTFDEAFNIAETLEEFAKNLILATLKKNSIFLESNGKLCTYTKKTFPSNEENPIINKLCFLIFNKVHPISFITLSTLPISQYVSKTLEPKAFLNKTEFSLRGIPAYFDDAAQIIGESAVVISKAKDIDFLEKYSEKVLAESCNALIVLGVGVLFFSEKEDETIYMASIFEKNALAFLLSLHNTNITPLDKENANSLHTSFIKGYSKLKNS